MNSRRAAALRDFDPAYGCSGSDSVIRAMSAARPLFSRLCCKSLKTPGDKFPARRRKKPRSLINVVSGSLPKSPVSLSPGDEVPHMFTRKPLLQPEKFAVDGANRLLQHGVIPGPCHTKPRETRR